MSANIAEIIMIVSLICTYAHSEITNIIKSDGRRPLLAFLTNCELDSILLCVKEITCHFGFQCLSTLMHFYEGIRRSSNFRDVLFIKHIKQYLGTKGC